MTENIEQVGWENHERKARRRMPESQQDEEKRKWLMERKYSNHK